MSKYVFKTQKKILNGLEKLSKIEEKEIADLVTTKPTGNFLIIHSGNGLEEDWKTLNCFLKSEIGLSTMDYSLG